ncbi:bifunctional DNA primase/polymerase [Streptomyces abikoensis]
MTAILTAGFPHLRLLAFALDAARRGWHVFPLRPDDKRPALHGEAACPRTGTCRGGHVKWEARATTDPDRITSAWTAGAYNVGLATGPSGLLVVDLDVSKDKSENDAPCGATSFMALCERAGEPVPATYRVRTASGGEHLYFRAPKGIRLGNTAGKVAGRIDTRGWGGYVVAPCSTTPVGAYTVTDDRAPAPLPAWLLGALTPKPKPLSAVAMPGTAAKSPGYAAAALRNEVHNVTTAADGTRNATLLRAARALGRLVASGDLDRTEVEQALSGAATATGGESQRYYDDVITRALNWSIDHNPRGRTT